MQSQTRGKVIIIGAGISGCVLGLHLKRSGFEPELYEKISASKDVGGSLAINVNGFRVLHAVDLAQKVIATRSLAY